MNNPNTHHESDTLLSDQKTAPPKRYGVFLLNDDYTTMEFVVKILMLLFGLGDVPCVSAAQAFAFVMNQKHHRHRLLLSEHKDFGQLQCIVEEI